MTWKVASIELSWHGRAVSYVMCEGRPKGMDADSRRTENEQFSREHEDFQFRRQVASFRRLLPQSPAHGTLDYHRRINLRFFFWEG